MPWRSVWFMPLSALVFFAAAFVTLRAAEHAVVQHPVPSTPEESATIADDPTTAPDPAQSADNNVSFPADI